LEYGSNTASVNLFAALQCIGMKTCPVGEMTRSEFREMIESVVEQKLLDLLGDPDDGLDLRSQIRERILRQQASVGSGDRGDLIGHRRDVYRN
jgi:hypothetical protein